MKWKAVGHYIKSGGFLIFMIVTLGHLLMLFTQSASYVWLQIWMDDAKNRTTDYYIVSYSIIGIIESKLLSHNGNPNHQPPPCSKFQF